MQNSIMGFNVDLFGERLKILRTKRGISTIRLGKELGVSDATISRWENGLIKPTAESIYNIAKFFGVSSDYLIGLVD